MATAAIAAVAQGVRATPLISATWRSGSQTSVSGATTETRLSSALPRQAADAPRTLEMRTPTGRAVGLVNEARSWADDGQTTVHHPEPPPLRPPGPRGVRFRAARPSAASTVPEGRSVSVATNTYSAACPAVAGATPTTFSRPGREAPCTKALARPRRIKEARYARHREANAPAATMLTTPLVSTGATTTRKSCPARHAEATTATP